MEFYPETMKGTLHHVRSGKIEILLSFLYGYTSIHRKIITVISNHLMFKRKAKQMPK